MTGSWFDKLTMSGGPVGGRESGQGDEIRSSWACRRTACR